MIDLEGGIDHGVPVLPNHTLYLYFPIFDEDLPDLDRLHGIAQLGGPPRAARVNRCSRTAAPASTARRSSPA